MLQKQQKSFSAPLYAGTVTHVPESYHFKQEDVLNQSREMRDSMEDAKTWLEKFGQESKEDNIVQFYSVKVVTKITTKATIYWNVFAY